jgi:putative permease
MQRTFFDQLRDSLMFELVRRFFRERFSNPEAATLLIVIVLGALVILLFGRILAPILAGLVIAFLCEPVVQSLHRYLGLPRLASVLVVFLIFIGVVVLGVAILLPMLGKQMSQAIDALPGMIKAFHNYLLSLPTRYPEYIHQKMMDELLSGMPADVSRYTEYGRMFFSYSLGSIPNILSGVVYVFLVPLSVLFFLKDKESILTWIRGYLPQKPGLLLSVGQTMKIQLGNYVRGKFIEIVIVAIGTYAIFWFFDLNYAVLLATLVGLSVIIPYVGMVLVTIPVIIICFMQFGFSQEFLYCFGSYLVFQVFDGNILVPILFSEAVNLHPIAIIAAALFFGGIWGFWGLFFAIPLATLVKTLINAWSRTDVIEESTE